MPRGPRAHLLGGYPSDRSASEKLVRIPLTAYQLLKVIQQERPPVDRRKWGTSVHTMRCRYPLSWIVREAIELLRATELAARPAPEKRYRTR